MPGILLHLIPASLYGALGFHFWHSRWWRGGNTDPRPGLQSWERVVLAVALLFHGYTLHAELFSQGTMRFGFGYALSLILWLALLIYWVESFYVRMDGLQTLALPLAAICTLLPALFPGQHVLPNAGSAVFRVHFLVAMVAYSLFTLAALHAIIMATVEKRLHRGQLSRPLASLPPLLAMEALLFRLILIAFVLLTLALVSGFVFSETLFGQAFKVDHKTLFSIISWLIFAGLLAGRYFRGWRGRIALRWTLAGFVTLLLAYVGSRFVLEVILGRAA